MRAPCSLIAPPTSKLVLIVTFTKRKEKRKGWGVGCLVPVTNICAAAEPTRANKNRNCVADTTPFRSNCRLPRKSRAHRQLIRRSRLDSTEGTYCQMTVVEIRPSAFPFFTRKVKRISPSLPLIGIFVGVFKFNVVRSSSLSRFDFVSLNVGTPSLRPPVFAHGLITRRSPISTNSNFGASQIHVRSPRTLDVHELIYRVPLCRGRLLFSSLRLPSDPA